MNSHASRKQLLIAESELNRALLAGDMADLRAQARALVERTKSVGSVASATAALVAGLTGSGAERNGDAKPSLLRKIMKGAGMISTVWLAIRSVRRDHREP